jgi:hypothetical protein
VREFCVEYWHKTAVSDVQAAVLQAVLPMRTLADVEKAPKFRPTSDSGKPELVGPLLTSHEDSTGASKVKPIGNVPVIASVVTTAAKDVQPVPPGWPAPACTWQLTAVLDVQDEVEQSVTPRRTVLVTSYRAKFKPTIDSTPPPVET